MLEGSAALMSRNLAESVERMTTIENLKRELLSQPGQSVRVSPPALNLLTGFDSSFAQRFLALFLTCPSCR